ncbi:MAG: HAD family hydrolase [Dehalococcoidia bacterium]|nr:MAG: HAD family hydrolase [Dehalococcoidia bacterium]
MSAMPPRVHAALFDLDGTLVDSFATIAEATVEAFRRHGHRVTPAEIIPLIGPPMDMVARKVTSASPDEAQAMYTTYQDLYYTEYIQRTPAHPGAHDLIEAMGAAGIALGVVTNKNEYGGRLMVTVQGWDGRFGSVVGRDTANHPKPHPEAALFALRALDTLPGQAALVGDTEYDMNCGRDAGLAYVIGITGARTAAHLHAEGATHVVDSLAEVGTILLGGNA